METLLACLSILLLAYIQNVSFSIVSRSRNRNNIRYHLFAAVGSNLIWFATMKELMTQNMTWVVALPYTIGTVAGSITGVKVSMKIEKWLGAASDDHLKK